MAQPASHSTTPMVQSFLEFETADVVALEVGGTAFEEAVEGAECILPANSTDGNHASASQRPAAPTRHRYLGAPLSDALLYATFWLFNRPFDPLNRLVMSATETYRQLSRKGFRCIIL